MQLEMKRNSIKKSQKSTSSNNYNLGVVEGNLVKLGKSIKTPYQNMDGADLITDSQPKEGETQTQYLTASNFNEATVTVRDESSKSFSKSKLSDSQSHNSTESEELHSNQVKDFEIDKFSQVSITMPDIPTKENDYTDKDQYI